MDNQTALNTLSVLKSNLELQITAINLAMEILTNGFTSDLAAIDAAKQEGIQEGLAQAVVETTPVP